MCNDGASDERNTKTPGGLGTPDVGSLVERIHTKAVRLSISILVTFFSSLCSKSESTRGGGIGTPKRYYIVTDTKFF